MQQTPKLAKPANFAINGFGRIGRCFVRAAEKRNLLGYDIRLVAVNEIKADPKLSMYLLKHDSIFHTFPREVSLTDDIMRISLNANPLEVKMLSEPDPAKLPWKQLGVDIVLESTGAEDLLTTESAKKHIQAGASKVMMSAPPKDSTPMVVMGVNDSGFNFRDIDVLSGASCTTNCAILPLKIIHDAFGVETYFILTTHAYTNDQNLIDGAHKNYYRSRDAAINIIPSDTGAAKTIGKIIPELEGKGTGDCRRVPVPDGSLVDMFVILKDPVVRVEDLNRVLVEATKKPEMQGLFSYSLEPLVSQDIIRNPHSGILMPDLTKKIGSMFQVVVWYDNEWGYANRMVDTILRMAEGIEQKP